MPDLSHDELRQGAEHLGYEWAMLLGARETNWHKLTSTSPLQGLANQHGRTEITLLHARTIYEFLFFTEASRFKDDVRATHFLHGADRTQWEVDRDNLAKRYCPTVRDDLGRLNKRLFHLSYLRADLEKGWDPEQIVSELKAAFRYFCTLLASELLLIYEGLLAHEVDPTSFEA